MLRGKLQRFCDVIRRKFISSRSPCISGDDQHLSLGPVKAKMSLLVVVFFVQVAIQILSTIGATSINNLVSITSVLIMLFPDCLAQLWSFYSRLPTPHSQKAASLRSLRPEVVALNKQMNNTSAQDDFAKWAKLRRQHDKKKEEYDKLCMFSHHMALR